jgi:serine/threonine protein kinase
MIGKIIAQYKILEKMGEGGMGVVYKVQDTKLDRLLALKFLPPNLTVKESDKARFLQEAKAASSINHPNVCVIHDIQEHDEQQFIVMEYVEGQTLRETIGTSGSLVPKIKDVINYALQIAAALEAAHNKSVIHRDIKSENIMVTKTNQIKVMDFGLAKLKGSLKLTKTSSTVGTLAYMAPEQIEGKATDARSDIFSFGVVLYEMLTGKLPFNGEYESALMYSILNDDPEPVENYRGDISSDLVHVLNRSLEKDPEDRYQTMHDVVIDLNRVKRDSSKVSRKSLKEMPTPEK